LYFAVLLGDSLATGKIQVYQNRTCVHEFRAHNDMINQIRHLNGDSKLVASASKDTTVKIWNLTDWSLIATYTGHLGNVYTIEQINETTIASGSFDTTIQVWTIDKVNKQKFRERERVCL
jgi:WD40 repeat protein